MLHKNKEAPNRLEFNQSRKFYPLISFLLIIFSLWSIYSHMPKENNFRINADEGHYFNYSKFISDNGLKSYSNLFGIHVKNKENWIWPSPLRVGYFLLSSLVFRIFGPSYRALAHISFASHIFFLLILMYFSKKYFGKQKPYFFCC